MLSLDCLSGCSHLCCSSMSSSLVGVIAASIISLAGSIFACYRLVTTDQSGELPAGMRFGGWGDFAPCLPVLLTCLLTHSHEGKVRMFTVTLPPPQPYKALSDLSHLPSPSPLLFHSMSSHNFSYSTRPSGLDNWPLLCWACSYPRTFALTSPLPEHMPWDVCTVYFLTFFSSSFKCHPGSGASWSSWLRPLESHVPSPSAPCFTVLLALVMLSCTMYFIYLFWLIKFIYLPVGLCCCTQALSLPWVVGYFLVAVQGASHRGGFSRGAQAPKTRRLSSCGTWA